MVVMCKIIIKMVVSSKLSPKSGGFELCLRHVRWHGPNGHSNRHILTGGPGTWESGLRPVIRLHGFCATICPRVDGNRFSRWWFWLNMTPKVVVLDNFLTSALWRGYPSWMQKHIWEEDKQLVEDAFDIFPCFQLKITRSSQSWNDSTIFLSLSRTL